MYDTPGARGLVGGIVSTRPQRIESAGRPEPQEAVAQRLVTTAEHLRNRLIDTRNQSGRIRDMLLGDRPEKLNPQTGEGEAGGPGLFNALLREIHACHQELSDVQERLSHIERELGG